MVIRTDTLVFKTYTLKLSPTGHDVPAGFFFMECSEIWSQCGAVRAFVGAPFFSVLASFHSYLRTAVFSAKTAQRLLIRCTEDNLAGIIYRERLYFIS